MRTDFELWLIVEQNFDEYFKRCLCDTIRSLYESEIITRAEDIHLRNIIYEYGKRRFFNRPILDPFTPYELIWKRWQGIEKSARSNFPKLEKSYKFEKIFQRKWKQKSKKNFR